MKAHTLGALVAGLVLVLSASVARADGDWGGCTNISVTWTNGGWGSGTCTNEDDQPQGGDIDGSETLIATIALSATTNAPAGASGTAYLISDNEGGISTNQCSITTTGLVSGVYSLSVVKKSDSSTVVLGTIWVGCRHGDDGEGDDQGDDDQGENDDSGEKCANSGGTCATVSRVELPPDLDPMDIGEIDLSDANGNVVLTGSLVDPTGSSVIKFRATVAAKGGTSGRAQALSTAKHGKRTDRFTMLGSGLTPNSQFTIVVNGKAVGKVKSNKKGNVLVRKLPANLLTVHAVRLVDTNGVTALSTKF